MFNTTIIEYFVLLLTPLFVVNISTWGVGQYIQLKTLA